MVDWNLHWAVIAGRVLLMFMLPLVVLPLMIWAERKMSAFMQDRTGPNRAAIGGVRLGGIIHTLADVLKLVSKEDIVPERVHPFYYRIAPFIALIVALILFVILPFADDIAVGSHMVRMQALQLPIGILYPLAMGALTVYATVLAGWASNNKFGTLGGLRAAAQMVSYEVALGLAIMGVIMIYGTLDLAVIVQEQSGVFLGFLPRWGIFLQPLGFILFMVAVFAETNRTPFDMAERDAEIVAGFHTEYSAVRFAAFFMGEYIHILVGSGIVVTLFLGGWQVPYLSTDILRQNGTTTLYVLMGVQLVGAVAVMLASLKWSRRLKAEYQDARRHEGTVLAVLGAGAALASLTILAITAQFGLPVWGQTMIVVILQLNMFVAKTLAIALSFIWVRWTLPSFRYDQLMALGWKQLMPFALANITVTGVFMWLMDRGGA
jgi:NADH-quinone oxidoreductase subunit H